MTKNGHLIVASGLGSFHSGPGKQEPTSLQQKAQKRNLDQRSNRSAKNSVGQKKKKENEKKKERKKKREGESIIIIIINERKK